MRFLTVNHHSFRIVTAQPAIGNQSRVAASEGGCVVKIRCPQPTTPAIVITAGSTPLKRPVKRPETESRMAETIMFHDGNRHRQDTFASRWRLPSWNMMVSAILLSVSGRFTGRL